MRRALWGSCGRQGCVFGVQAKSGRRELRHSKANLRKSTNRTSQQCFPICGGARGCSRVLDDADSKRCGGGLPGACLSCLSYETDGWDSQGIPKHILERCNSASFEEGAACQNAISSLPGWAKKLAHSSLEVEGRTSQHKLEHATLAP